MASTPRQLYTLTENLGLVHRDSRVRGEYLGFCVVNGLLEFGQIRHGTQRDIKVYEVDHMYDAIQAINSPEFNKQFPLIRSKVEQFFSNYTLAVIHSIQENMPKRVATAYVAVESGAGVSRLLPKIASAVAKQNVAEGLRLRGMDLERQVLAGFPREVISSALSNDYELIEKIFTR